MRECVYAFMSVCACVGDIQKERKREREREIERNGDGDGEQ